VSETTSPKPSAGINTWLTKKIASGGIGQGATGQPLEVDIDLLDANPKQPRQEMDEEALAELVDSIRLYGLVQPISVTRQADGRYIILAGHRRTEAIRRLRDGASAEDRAKWTKVPATDRGPTAMDQLAELALTENLLRDDLRPMETAEALSDLRATRQLSTEQLAEHLGLELTKTKRLLQLAGAPPSVREALGKGLMVQTSEEVTASGKPRREHRHLELSHALHVLKAYGHWQRTKPKKALDLTRSLIERVLAEGWPLRRLKDHVDSLVAGKVDSRQETAGEGAPAETTPTETSHKSHALFLSDGERLVVHRTRLPDASAEEKAALRGALKDLLAQLA
jgi:ParB/RepB/Spo0J family partition protein